LTEKSSLRIWVAGGQFGHRRTVRHVDHDQGPTHLSLIVKERPAEDHIESSEVIQVAFTGQSAQISGVGPV
jgi:hypothetical protein|tara:strand:- start:14 stop:226 length:213 start_codon:yes stop_codon:yes gene_type:complete